ncbi:GNAT family N-acetyltransferase [Streptomyces sp. I4(2020)]|uniref:GNAT family N-acetyltransferase n=1 Tax=Streptomyces sp. I4(2020) TaxID=2760981 RepID=UPI0018EE7462|nr:GNAT family N-acetyltransferase [Streptomyces sp. I4(2020)]MBJ6616423.1 GNAT family N-acetyltransferase [Streptomyces sp. I3(2020)]MBJ6627100.1 GNAT family N-acetyltransferase [Streptomyces sp. I4(2020)]
MRIRAFTPRDLASLTDLTIETFRPFYEDSFRPLVGETVFANQHGDWRDDYRREVPRLHAPERHRYVAVAEAGDDNDNGDGDDGDGLAGYVAWSVDPDRRNGSISHLAVSAQHRRHHVGTALCEHAFAHMRSLGAEVVEIGTGGDPFHAPARALYERLGCTALPTAVYYRQL